jgi:protein-S-isoprenylcysteine O-methyltransferase Ste14
MFIFKKIFGVVLNVAIFGVLLFGPAGTLRWWRAWVFLGVVMVGVIATMIGAFSANEELLDERYKPPIQQGQPLADRVLVIALILFFCSVIAFIPLDVFRFHLAPKPGALVSFAGLLLFAWGWLIISLSFKENTFAAPVVKHQEERHQRVIDSGVYGVVRHPMYAGAIALLIGIPLWLQSYAGTLLTVVPIAILAARIRFEEQFLRRELKGYDAYMQRVRYRLIPWVW